MKKTLLAMALAVGCSGVASAQTSVTLFGIVDAGLEYLQFKDKATGVKATRFGGTRDGVNRAGNRWGLRGSEDLGGGGLKAIFHLESGFDIFTGTSQQGGRLFGRAAALGLSSDVWGTVRFGRYYNWATLWAGGVISPWGDSFAEPNIGATFKATRQQRYDNSLTYESPSFAGFQFGLGYSFNIAGDQPFDVNGVADRDRTAFTTALRYNNGPMELIGTYDQINKADNVPGQRDIKSWILGASYNFDVVKLHLGFGQDRNGVVSPRPLPALPAGIGQGLSQSATLNSETGYKANNYTVGVGIPVGEAGRFSVGWQSSRLGSGAYKDTVRAAGGKNSQNIYAALYSYTLSKRTSAHVFAAYGTGYAFNNVTMTQAVLGLNHMF